MIEPVIFTPEAEDDIAESYNCAGSPIGAILSVIPIVIAPLAILISSFVLYRRHRDSRFHSAAFWSGLAYIGLITLIGTIISCGT